MTGKRKGIEQFRWWAAWLVVMVMIGGGRVSGNDGDRTVPTGTPPATFTPYVTPTPGTPSMTVRVPGDYATIQAALDGVAEEAEIQVYPGVYRENLVWPATGGLRLITVGEAGTVTIDGGFAGRGVTMIDVPPPAAEMRGLRITHGRSEGDGAGILLDGSSLRMVRCEIFDNQAIPDGAGNLSRPGINCIQSELVMLGCHVHDHMAIGSVGSGLTIESPGKEIVLQNCLFTDNYNRVTGQYGGAVTHRYGTLRVDHCQFIGNFAREGAALHIAAPAMISNSLITGSRSENDSGCAVFLDWPGAMFLYNTVAENRIMGMECRQPYILVRGNVVTANDGGGIKVAGAQAIFLEYNDFWRNLGLDYVGTPAGETDFSANPLFVAGDLGSYYLSQVASGQDFNSPCVDAGDPLSVPSGFTRTDQAPDTGVTDLGFHRRSDLPAPVPTWTPWVPTSTPTPVTPTPTSGSPTPTPTLPPPTPTHTENVILVPWEEDTIQFAIDAACDGNTILVDTGTYSGNGNVDISFRGKQITVMSMAGPEWTTLDCGGSETDPHRGFIFDDEGSQSILDGFTIINGCQALGGGIILLNNARPHIRNCVIRNCRSMSYGGGVHALYSGFTMEKTVIESCSARDGGGGISFWGDGERPSMLYRCFIRENKCNSGNAGGVDVQFAAAPVLVCSEITGNENQGVLLDSSRTARMEIDNCLFAGNLGGVDVQTGSADIVNCTFAGNAGFAVRGNGSFGTVNLLRSCLWGAEDTAVDITTAEYCNLPGYGKKDHCFYLDPMFVPGPRGDYYVFQNVPQMDFSPNVNTGGVAADTVIFPRPSGIMLPLNELTTCDTEFLDKRFADVGYHYPVTDDEPYPTPDPGPERPIIEEVLGSTQDYQANSRMRFTIIVHVDDPQGLDDITSVQLYWENFPTPWMLEPAGDGEYRKTLEFAAGSLPAHDYLMNIAAFDRRGNVCETMPYTMAVEDPPPSGKPVIDGRHSWFKPVTPGRDETGALYILASVSHPDGPDHIRTVEILYDDIPTGLTLLDNGLNGDLQPGDGYYGIIILYNGLQFTESVDVTLGIRATDIDGNVSTTWPVRWKTE